MKKYLLLIMTCTAFNATVYAQKIDYDRIILPDNIGTEIPFEERLVQIAWKNSPMNSSLQAELRIKQYEVPQASLSWLNNITASGNLNEFTINPGANDRALFFPRYNFSVSVSLGTIFLTPNRTKVARENINITKENINQLKLEIREKVLTAYEAFKAAEKLLILQEEITADQQSQLNLIEDQFKAGEIGLDVYSESQRAFNTERRSRIIAQQNYNVAKINLEKLIGVKLEEIR